MSSLNSCVMPLSTLVVQIKLQKVLAQPRRLQLIPKLPKQVPKLTVRKIDFRMLIHGLMFLVAFNAIFGIITNFAAVAEVDDVGNIVNGTSSTVSNTS